MNRRGFLARLVALVAALPGLGWLGGRYEGRLYRSSGTEEAARAYVRPYGRPRGLLEVLRDVEG